MIPCCWPADGRCGCGRNHVEHDIGKAALVKWRSYVVHPPTEVDLARWRRTWPSCNWGELLEPIGVLEVDVDSDAALGEATALGLPPAPVMKTARGRRNRYRCPPELRGIRITHRGQSRHIDIFSAGYVVVEGRHRLGPRYEWVVSPREQPPGPAPRWVLDWLRASAHQDDGRGRAPAAIEANFTNPGPVDLDRLDIHPRIVAIITSGTGPTYPSRSEVIFSVIHALLKRGLDDATITAVLLDERYGISDKPRAKGRRWVAAEIARARAKSTAVVL